MAASLDRPPACHARHLQVNFRKLLRQQHHQAERLQQPPELLPPVQHPPGHGRAEERARDLPAGGARLPARPVQVQRQQPQHAERQLLPRQAGGRDCHPGGVHAAGEGAPSARLWK